jgi:hypothetical protein
METVLGLFARFEDAWRTVMILRESGFSEDGLRILSREEILGEVERIDLPGTEFTRLKENIANCAKDLLGALVGLVISDQKALIYSDGVKQGGALVIARTPIQKANDVRRTMAGQHAVEIQQIFSNISGDDTGDSNVLEPYVPLLWHQLNEA